MPGQPLVVLHTALTDSVARSMRELLPPEAAAAAAAATSQQQPRRPGPSHHGSASSERTWEQREQQQQERHLPASNAAAPGAHFQHQQQPSVAVFYSISATQRGLAGVDLGNFLIKQVPTHAPACKHMLLCSCLADGRLYSATPLVCICPSQL
jgi:malonyl-CoA decarboxylase